MLKDVSGVNAYTYTPTAEIIQGNQADVFFQLVDASVELPTSGANPSGRRWCPSNAATLLVTFKSIDCSVTVCRAAALAWSTQDTSIWKVTLFATDSLVGTYVAYLKLTDGSVVTLGSIQQALQVKGLKQYSC